MSPRDLRNVPVYCSWSGGKDCALALHHAVLRGARPRALVTMMTADGRRSRSHGLSRAVLQEQAEALGLPIHFGCADWAAYEETFQREIARLVATGVRTGVYGDLDVHAHRAWVASVCAGAGSIPVLPLWQRERADLMRELLEVGFRAQIVAVRDGVLPQSLLGGTVDARMLDRFDEASIDLAGENGEYHTLVVDGPIFERPMEVAYGETSLRDGVWFVDVEARETGPGRKSA